MSNKNVMILLSSFVEFRRVLFDEENNDIFKIKISGKYCEYVYKKVNVSDLVYVICTATNNNKEIIFNLQYIQVL